MKNVKADDLEDLSDAIRNKILVTREALLTIQRELDIICSGYQSIEEALKKYEKRARGGK